MTEQIKGEQLVCHDVNGNPIEVVPQRRICVNLGDNRYVAIEFNPKTMTDEGVIFPIVYYTIGPNGMKNVENIKYIIGVDFDDLEILNRMYECFKKNNDFGFHNFTGSSILKDDKEAVGLTRVSRQYKVSPLFREDGEIPRSFQFEEDNNNITGDYRSERFRFDIPEETATISHKFSFFDS